MFGEEQKLSIPKAELPARLAAAESLHAQVRALLGDVAAFAEQTDAGRVSDAAGRLRAPVEALDATLARITEAMRRGVS